MKLTFPSFMYISDIPATEMPCFHYKTSVSVVKNLIHRFKKRNKQ